MKLKVMSQLQQTLFTECSTVFFSCCSPKRVGCIVHGELSNTAAWSFWWLLASLSLLSIFRNWASLLPKKLLILIKWLINSFVSHIYSMHTSCLPLGLRTKMNIIWPCPWEAEVGAGCSEDVKMEEHKYLKSYPVFIMCSFFPNASRGKEFKILE